MRIAIHDAEADHFGTYDKFPNYALMKISAWHKAHGDSVEWFTAMDIPFYDKIYSSKVFDFTPDNPFLPSWTIKGGTGYKLFDELPREIDDMFPDYSIYPTCDYAIGYLTRGCIRKCPWCIVPKKEGYIRPYSVYDGIKRRDSDRIVFMDNNVLACEHGIEQIRRMAENRDVQIDFNQGLDLRLMTEEIAEIFSRVRWIKYIRFSVDQKSQIEPLKRVVSWLEKYGVKASKLFLYCIITKDKEDNLARIYAIRDIAPTSTIYAQPEKNPTLGIMPDHWQNIMAQKYVYGGMWRKMSWEEYLEKCPEPTVKVLRKEAM